MNYQAKNVINWCIDIKTAPNLWYNKITTIQIIQRRGADLMINQMSQNENTQNQFSNAIRELKVGKLLRKANITKSYAFMETGGQLNVFSKRQSPF